MEQMIFLHTTRRTFDKNYEEPGASWSEFIRQNDMHHLSELVSLDTSLNKILFEPDYENADDLSNIFKFGDKMTSLYTSLEYVLKKTQTSEKFNLMSLMFEPYKDCGSINIYGYDFLGYELLDQGFTTSALTNGGGFPETFAPSDLNKFGLVDRYVYAYDMKRRLLENNPNEPRADTNVIAVWRDTRARR